MDADHPANRVPFPRRNTPGFIEERDLAALYGLCSLFVFPSMHEGFGLPPLEAMACGAPVLAARNSSLPEVIGRDDLLFDTFDAAELAAKMLRVLTDPAHAAELRAWGAAQSGRFSWDATGRKAIDALQRLHERHLATGRTNVAFGRRPRLAFFSPLPSDRSGVADYSAELLRELGRFYDVECIIKDTQVTDPWLVANFVFRDVEFFKRHVESFDRIVYCVGNSDFHVHMLELMETHPGVVILHDFFLSGVHVWLGNVGQRPMDDFLCELYLTHGLPALRYCVEHGRMASARQYPANRLAFEESLCVIVHSEWSVARAEEVFGASVKDKIVQVPQLRGVGRHTGRDQARARLGLGRDDVLVCTFGFVADTKLSREVFEAWGQTKAAQAPGALLAFVGENMRDPYGDRLQASIMEAEHPVHAVITGFVDPVRYEDYLAAADLAVQLRTGSRGETSRALLDCMAAGVPVIVNAHGTLGELPGEVVARLPDVVEVKTLAAAIDALHADPVRRRALGAAGLRHVQDVHNPHAVGDAVIDAIERFSRRSQQGRQRHTLAALRELYAPTYPSEQDLKGLSGVLAGHGRRVRLRRILFDVTLLAEADTHTGIERVVRSLLAYLLDHTPAGHMLESVRIEGGSLVFARRFVSRRLGIPADVLPDNPVDHDAGDIYVALEWAADRLPHLVGWLERFRQDGGRVVIGVNDLLPMTMPHRFPPFIGTVAERWFETVLLCADQVICISRSVADDVLRFGNLLSERRNAPIGVDWYHLGSELSETLPTTGLPPDAASRLMDMKRRPTFVMVGTVEPRKGHAQVLRAFARLWSQNVDAGLVIVGKQGWMVETVERLVASSPENGKRLLWLRDISDEFLEKIYGNAVALIAASEGEGFGLPLVEAARHGIPVIARDIPVFREVAGAQASYFDTASPEALADVLRDWLAASRRHPARVTTGPKPLSWQDAGAQFVTALFATEHYGRID